MTRFLSPNPRVVSADGHSAPERDHVAARHRMALPFEPRRRLVVVDAHGHAFRAFWALEAMHAPDGLPTNALFGLAGLLRRIVLEERPDYVAVVFDAADDVRRTFRTKIYPEYKAHRPERPAELALQLPMLRDVAHALGLRILEHPDYEADDIVATVVALAEADNVDTTIMSADKDLLQLVSDRTLVWDAMRGKRYTHQGVREKLGVGPDMVADYLALCGDTSDNVPGVPGIGPKGAAGLLRAHGTLERIFEMIEEVPTRERKKLVEHRARAFLSQSLTRLKADVPIGLDLAALALPAVNEDAGADLWARLGFMSFLPEAARHRRDWSYEAPARAPMPEQLPALVVEQAPIEAPAPEPIADALAEAIETVEVIDVHDVSGLLAALTAARAAQAFGLAMRGEAPRPPPKMMARGRRIQVDGPPVVPPVLGLALPSGATWRINVRAEVYGRPVQGSLFEVPAVETGLALADVAAALASLLADSKRVLCAHDARRILPALGIASGRAAIDFAHAEAELDPAAIALDALSSWLDGMVPA